MNFLQKLLSEHRSDINIMKFVNSHELTKSIQKNKEKILKTKKLFKC